MNEPTRPFGDGFVESLPVRSRTILLCDDDFADIWESGITQHLEDKCDLRFIRFDSQQRLRELLETGCADLVLLYIGNIRWNPDPVPPAKRPSSAKATSYFGSKIDILGELSRLHRVPVIAIQGTDLRAEAERAGITFLEAPFKFAKLMPAVLAALGIQPPAGPQ